MKLQSALQSIVSLIRRLCLLISSVLTLGSREGTGQEVIRALKYIESNTNIVKKKMQKPIMKKGNPLLAKICQPITDIETVRPIIADMKDTLDHISRLYEFKRGHGIAAPQIGHLVRINIVQFDGITQVLINPSIIDFSSDQIPIREGCLSFFDVRGNVPRYKTVTVTALDENGCQITIKASDNFAMLLQHELDHLDGILYVDRLLNGEKDLYAVEGMPLIP